MTNSEKKRSRLRWVTLGEAVAVAALVVSALGLWHSWRSEPDKPVPDRIVAVQQPVPLALRGRAEDDGRVLVIAPVEDGHALDSVTIGGIGSAQPITLGSDGRLQARDFEEALGKTTKRPDGIQRAPVRIDARYIEAGKDRRGGGRYTLSYRWKDGGLLSGRSVRLVGLARS